MSMVRAILELLKEQEQAKSTNPCLCACQQRRLNKCHSGVAHQINELNKRKDQKSNNEETEQAVFGFLLHEQSHL